MNPSLEKGIVVLVGFALAADSAVGVGSSVDYSSVVAARVPGAHIAGNSGLYCSRYYINDFGLSRIDHLVGRYELVSVDHLY